MWRAAPLPILACLGAALACGPGPGARSFEEVEAARALGWLASGAAVLVQVREATAPTRALPGATRFGAEEPLPDALAGEFRRVIVVARDPGLARQAAARITRAGAPRVAVVRGGLQAWLAAADDGRPPSAALGPDAGADT